MCVDLTYDDQKHGTRDDRYFHLRISDLVNQLQCISITHRENEEQLLL